MRHFPTIETLTDALADEAERLGCTVLRRDGRVFAAVAQDCTCGTEHLHEIDLSLTAERIWKGMEE